MFLLQMPHRYLRRTSRASWDEEQITLALNAITAGRSLRAASRAFSIPRSTLQDRMRSGSTSGPLLGRHTVFSADAENELADQIVKLSKLFFGITRDEV